MVPLTPAVVGLPGGVEVVLILFVLFLLFGVPIALAVVLGYRYVSGQTEADRVDELEEEVAALREHLDAGANDERLDAGANDERLDAGANDERLDDEEAHG